MKVMTAQGRFLHDTYERRARGLVKKGRAYYVDETTICLLDISGKEHSMEPITKEELFKEMETMLNNQEYFKMAINAIEKIPAGMEEEQVELRTTAIMNMVKEKEATQQKLIDLWAQMVQS